MKDLKTGFSDRITAQQEAKKALLAKFKPKAAAPDPEFDKLAEKARANLARFSWDKSAGALLSTLSEMAAPQP